MLDTNGYIKLIDFGICKRLPTKDTKTNTEVGTPDYISPEIILGEGHDLSTDWWSFGVF